MSPDHHVRAATIAYTIPTLVIALLVALSLGACGSSEPAAPAAPAPAAPAEAYDPAAVLQALQQAEPNAPTDGRAPWLGAAAWDEALQASEQYVADFPTPQNVQVLTDMSNAEINTYMQEHVSVALGVSCQYCHDISDYAANPYPEVLSAKRMMTMLAELNGQFITQLPDWQGNYVQCATCHNGQAIDLSAFSPAGASLAASSLTDRVGADQTISAATIDTAAVDPDAQYVLDHPKTPHQVALVTWLERTWNQHALPRTQPITQQQDRQKYLDLEGTTYSVAECYTCHQGSRVPPAAINQSELDALPDGGKTVLPPALRATNASQ